MHAEPQHGAGMPAAEHDPPAGGQVATSPAGQLVPYWLLGAVAVLLVAVLGVGGYVLTLVANKSGGDELTSANDVATWQQRVARDPGNAEALIGLGYAYQEEGSFAEAIETYDEAVAADTANLGALYNRGLCQLEVGEPTAAEESFAAALAVAPEHALAAKALGEQYRITERYSLIAAAVEAAADAHPEMADLQALMGLAHEHAGDRVAAVAEYREALARDPDFALAREGLARLGVSADE